jgi:hypothetical protein
MRPDDLRASESRLGSRDSARVNLHGRLPTVTSQEMLGRISVKDIAAAIQEVKTERMRLQNGRGAMTWCIQFQEVAYPTNYILELAVKSVTGETFVPDTRKGAKQIIKTLKQMLEKDFRFKVVFRQTGSTAREPGALVLA